MVSHVARSSPRLSSTVSFILWFFVYIQPLSLKEITIDFCTGKRFFSCGAYFKFSLSYLIEGLLTLLDYSTALLTTPIYSGIIHRLLALQSSPSRLRCYCLSNCHHQQPQYSAQHLLFSLSDLLF